LKNLLMKCQSCGTYTIKEVCPKDGLPTVISHPARFSPDDKYARYRSPLAYQEKKSGPPPADT
jgi:H/ACA ribonucleoprotein complex subunit 3